MWMILMHKDEKLIELDINQYGIIEGLGRKNNNNLLPYPLQKKYAGLQAYKTWIKDRAIPSTRHGINELLKNNKVERAESLLVKNLGLSLTDCYWLKPVFSEYTWEDVNLFQNDFAEALIYNGKSPKIHEQIKLSPYSPDGALQGELKKKWIISQDGKRMLVKGNYGTNFQQSLNEEFATIINNSQNFKEYVSYTLEEYTLNSDIPGICCISENFIPSDKVEFVSAWDVYCGEKLQGSKSPYYIFLDACEKGGLDRGYVEQFLEYQILLDYLITNPDRHFNNFGIIRDSDTMEMKSMAPVFDCGNSMFWNQDDIKFSPQMFEKVITHSFLKHEKDLLKYVKDFNRIDTGKVPNADEIAQIYQKDPNITENKIHNLVQCVHYKKNMVEHYQIKQSYRNMQNKKHDTITSGTVKQQAGMEQEQTYVGQELRSVGMRDIGENPEAQNHEPNMDMSFKEMAKVMDEYKDNRDSEEFKEAIKEVIDSVDNENLRHALEFYIKAEYKIDITDLENIHEVEVTQDNKRTL